MKLSSSKVKATYQSSKPSFIAVSKKRSFAGTQSRNCENYSKVFDWEKSDLSGYSSSFDQKNDGYQYEIWLCDARWAKEADKISFLPKSVLNKKLSYQSSNKKVIRIGKKGMIQAVKPGTARITVMAADGSKKKAIVKIVVKR